MCTELSRHYDDGETLQADAAGSFAAAGVLATLGPDDWQVSQDVEARMSDMVARLGGRATEVTVLIHRDHIELVAAATGRMEHHVLSAPAGFRTAIACTLG